MDPDLIKARENFVQGMSRISNFWGFPRAMGAIYGAIYLSPAPLSLDEIVEQVNVTKGAVSTHVRTLERLGMVHKQIRLGDRKDYYEAEADFWKIIKGVLREREQNEFDLAINTVGESLEMVKEGGTGQGLTQFIDECAGLLDRAFIRPSRLAEHPGKREPDFPAQGTMTDVVYNGDGCLEVV